MMFQIALGFTLSAQADLMTDSYKFTNLTQNRVLVKYESETPFLKKGHELHKGECLYIQPNQFKHLSILLHTESSNLLFCDSNSNYQSFCQSQNYTLVSVDDLKQDIENPSKFSIIKEHFAYLQEAPAIQYSTPYTTHYLPPQEFALIKNLDLTDTEECDVF